MSNLKTKFCEDQSLIDLENVPNYLDALGRAALLLHRVPEDFANEAREIAAELHALGDMLRIAQKRPFVLGKNQEERKLVPAPNFQRRGKLDVSAVDICYLGLSMENEFNEYGDEKIGAFINWRYSLCDIDKETYSKAFFEGVAYERMIFSKNKTS